MIPIVLRVCLDLNVWCGAFLSEQLGRSDTAAQSLVAAVRSGQCERGPVALVISWGMLNRMREVLERLGFEPREAERLTELIATYAHEGPSLTLGGVGVLPLDDTEDRHVMETAWAGEVDLLVTHNLDDFAGDSDALVPDRILGASRGGAKLIVSHTYDAAAWLRGEPWPEAVDAFLAARGRVQG